MVLTVMRPHVKACAAAHANAKPAHACDGDVRGALFPAAALHTHAVRHQGAQAVLRPEGWRQHAPHILLIPAQSRGHQEPHAAPWLLNSASWIAAAGFCIVRALVQLLMLYRQQHLRLERCEQHVRAPHAGLSLKGLDSFAFGMCRQPYKLRHLVLLTCAGLLRPC